MKAKPLLIAFIAGLLAGFFIGRATINGEEKIVWRQGETVVRPVPVPKVDWFEVPKVYFLPTTPDTVIIDDIRTVVQKVDTSKIIDEYIRVNHYNFNLFDDESGKLDLKQSLQYNRILDIEYSFTPRYKEITKMQRQLFTPVVGALYSVPTGPVISGGVFVGNVGIEYQYMFNFNAHGIGIKYKFE